MVGRLMDVRVLVGKGEGMWQIELLKEDCDTLTGQDLENVEETCKTFKDAVLR